MIYTAPFDKAALANVTLRKGESDYVGFTTSVSEFVEDGQLKTEKIYQKLNLLQDSLTASLSMHGKARFDTKGTKLDRENLELTFHIEVDPNPLPLILLLIAVIGFFGERSLKHIETTAKSSKPLAAGLGLFLPLAAIGAILFLTKDLWQKKRSAA